MLDIFNKIRKKIYKNNMSKLVSAEDLVILPPKSSLSNLELEKLNTYKKEFINILSSNNDSNLEIIVNNLRHNINFTINILLNHFLYDDIRTNFRFFNDEYNLSREEQEIICLRLKYHQMKIEENYKETILRLMALKELNNEKKFLFLRRMVNIFENGKLKKNILNNSIEDLLYVVMCAKSQIVSLSLEINTYLNKISVNPYSKMNPDYFNNLCNIAKKVIPEILLKINALEVNEEIKIALISNELEYYVYNNKDKFEEIKEKLKKLGNITSNDIEKELKEIEQYYYLYGMYGHKVITSKDLEELYNVKFSIITRNINSINTSIINDKMNHFEVMHYMDTVMQKLEAILKNENTAIKEIFKDDDVNAIKILKKIFKKDGEYNQWFILNNPNYLALLLSLDSKESFNRFWIEQRRAIDNINTEQFEFEDVLSLDTIYCLSIDTGNLDSFCNNDSLKELYYLADKHKEETEFYKIPEGITKISIESFGTFYVHYIKDSNMFRIIEKKAQGKVLVLPKSLKIIYGWIFRRSTITGIILNDGLETFDFKILQVQRIGSIKIPSSVRKLNLPMGVDPYGHLDDFLQEFPLTEICFSNYKESQFLKDENKKKLFLKSIRNDTYNFFTDIHCEDYDDSRTYHINYYEKKMVAESFYSDILKKGVSPFYDSFDRLIPFRKVRYQISSKPFAYNSIHTDLNELRQNVEDKRKILKK